MNLNALEAEKTPKNDILEQPTHAHLLEKFLKQINRTPLHSVLGVDENLTLKQKHLVYACIKEVLRLATANGWSLCINNGYVYVYNGAYWQPIEKEVLKQFLSEAAQKLGIIEYEAKHYEFADKLLKQFLTSAYLPAPEIDQNKVLINLIDGTFEFTPNGWKLRPHDKSDFLKYQLNFTFNANATCSLFDKFLLKCLPDADARLVLQEFAGYIFTNLNLEKCLVLFGDGGNGKSVYMRILCALIGETNVSNTSMGHFNHEYNRATLVNILLNYSSEKGTDLAPDTFKALVSAEPIQAREIYQKPFTLRNRAKFITNTNELPRETEQTEAYFRRFLIIGFHAKITAAEKDIDLANKIIANELPGVFNWLLEGLQRLLINRKFTESEAMRKELDSFKEGSDSVRLFAKEYRYIKATETNERKKELADLYKEYKMFCIDDGYKPLGKNRFAARFEKNGFEKIRLTGGAAGFNIGIEKDTN